MPIAITPGLTLTDPRRIDRANVQLLSAGVSESVQGFPPLENVPGELEAVGAVFPGAELLNDQFAIARFTDALQTQALRDRAHRLARRVHGRRVAELPARVGREDLDGAISRRSSA